MSDVTKDGLKEEDGSEEKLSSVSSEKKAVEIPQEDEKTSQEETIPSKDEEVAVVDGGSPYGRTPTYSSMVTVDLEPDASLDAVDKPEEGNLQETPVDDSVVEEEVKGSDIKKDVRKELDSLKQAFDKQDEQKEKPKDTPLKVKADSFESSVEETSPTIADPKLEENNTEKESKEFLSMNQLPPEIQQYFKDVHPGDGKQTNPDPLSTGKKGSDSSKDKTPWTTTVLDNIKIASKATVKATRHIEVISYCFVIICALLVGVYGTKAYFSADKALVSELWNTVIMAILTLAWANNSGRLPTKKNKAIKNRIKDMKNRLTNTGEDEY